MAKKIEVNQEVIIIRSKIEGFVEEVKSIDADIAELEALYMARLKELEERYQSKVLNLKANRERVMGQINGLFDLAEAKATKTQEKLTLLSGDVVRKKATLKFNPDKARLLEWAKESDMSVVKTTVKEDVDWSSLKARLVMQQDLTGQYVALDTATGEIVPGVTVVEEESKMEVK